MNVHPRGQAPYPCAAHSALSSGKCYMYSRLLLGVRLASICASAMLVRHATVRCKACTPLAASAAPTRGRYSHTQSSTQRPGCLRPTARCRPSSRHQPFPPRLPPPPSLPSVLLHCTSTCPFTVSSTPRPRDLSSEGRPCLPSSRLSNVVNPRQRTSPTQKAFAPPSVLDANRSHILLRRMHYSLT